MNLTSFSHTKTPEFDYPFRLNLDMFWKRFKNW